MEAKPKGSPQMNHISDRNEEKTSTPRRPLSGSGKPRPPLPKKPPKPANLLNRQTSQEGSRDVSASPPKPAPKPSRGHDVSLLSQISPCSDAKNQTANISSSHLSEKHISSKNSLVDPVGDCEVTKQSDFLGINVSSNCDASESESITVITGRSTEDGVSPEVKPNKLDHNALNDITTSSSIPGSHHDIKTEGQGHFCDNKNSKSTTDSKPTPKQQKVPPTISPKPKKPTPSPKSGISLTNQQHLKNVAKEVEEKVVNSDSGCGHCDDDRSLQNDQSSTGSVLSRVAMFNQTPPFESGSPNSGRRRLLQWQPDKNKFMEMDNTSAGPLNSYGSQVELSTNSPKTPYKAVRSQSFQVLPVTDGSERHMLKKGGRMNQSLDSGFNEQPSFEPVKTGLPASSDVSLNKQIPSGANSNKSPAIQRSKSALSSGPPKPMPRTPRSSRPTPTPRKRSSLDTTDAEDLIAKLTELQKSGSKTAESDSDKRLEENIKSFEGNDVLNEKKSVDVIGKETGSSTSQDEQMVVTMRKKKNEFDINANEYLDSASTTETVTPASPPPPIVPPKQTDISCKYKDISKASLSNDDTSSLLNDIEKILANSFPICLGSNSRPHSFGASETPVRPPRNKKMNKKADGNSDSDSELLKSEDSDLSFKGSTQSLSAISDVSQNRKQCPPKPVRKNLRKVNRSQSDVSDVRQLVLQNNAKGRKMETEGERNSTGNMPSDSSRVSPLTLRGQSGVLTPDFCMPANQESLIRERIERSRSLPSNRKLKSYFDDDMNSCNDKIAQNERLMKSKSHRSKARPKRPAPPPPPPNVTAAQQIGKILSSSLNISHTANVHLSHSERLQGNLCKSEHVSVELGKTRSDRHSSGDSDENEYHEIPDDLWKGGDMRQSPEKDKSYSSSLTQENKEKSPSPPDLPPRNDPTRPDSMVSVVSNSDSGSIGQGSPAQESSSSEDDDEDPEVRKERKRQKKVFYIAREMASSEKVFVDVLQLLNVDFRVHISKATEDAGRPIIPQEVMNKILSHLPMLHSFNIDLLKDLEDRVQHCSTGRRPEELMPWRIVRRPSINNSLVIATPPEREEKKEIADIFVKKGPFLKLYTSYIQDFSDMCAVLDDATKKIPLFQAALKEFELSPRCASLAVKHYMLKPIQRIPQYRLMLQDYRKHLLPDSTDYKNTEEALNIVSKVADHANESMKKGDQVQKMLEIQKSLDGHFEVIKPGRVFIKSGELMKLSRKEIQPRMFFLFNDVLLYTMPIVGGYKLKNALTLVGMKVNKNNLEEYKTEFSIISMQRSFTVEASTSDERDEWIQALTKAISDQAQKRNTFEKGAHDQQSIYDKNFVLGASAPVWIPDSRVTMCMMCTSEFSVTWRRHHCRACGKVVCSNCSENKVALEYMQNKPDKPERVLARVCDDCFDKLKAADPNLQDGVADDDNEPQNPSLFFSLTDKIFRRSGRPRRPARLREVHANDQGSTICGNLKILQGRKWKKCWFVVKDKVLYTYKASEDMAAIDSMPILGYDVDGFTEFHEGVHSKLLFQLKHKNRPPVIFQTESASLTNKWVKAMQEATSVTDS